MRWYCAVAVTNTATRPRGSSSAVVLQDGLHNMSNITPTVAKRRRTIALKRSAIAGRMLSSCSVPIASSAVLKCWSVRTKSRVAECRSVNRRSGAKTGTLANGSVVAGNKRGMVSPQPTDVESRMKPERCR
ncbi:hypothetical protein PR003_g14440 [Phytophthora rubi]|uniref:Uncharacterized protein n=1 Tax=Phytophthora rubi TaxID=129364 RepID=A0A6A4F2P8_9STRA|nr:hypothetical protein PR001_g13769 [Phytophthora rubi]KAE9332575.1 hypothetical protein PR003_g14440 [Phytophthora rubi]